MVPVPHQLIDMPYNSVSPATRMLYLAYACPYRFAEGHCAGGDYCSFPAGLERRCCFYCPEFESCPDSAGICQRFTGD